MHTQPNQHLLIIAPTAPPAVCGVSDYSYQTARVLTKSYHSVAIGVEHLPTLTQASATTDSDSITVARWQHLLVQAATTPEGSDVLLNYTPTSYARSGVPVELMLALRRFTRARATNRLFIFFHETWNGSHDLRPHHALQARLARWSMRHIGQLAGGIAVVNAEQQQKLAYLLQRNNIRLNSVGANIIPPTPESGLTSIRQAGTWVIFGLSHTRLWTLQTHLSLLQTMYAQGVLQQLYTIGPTDTSYAQQEAKLATNCFGTGVFAQLGALEPAEVSTQLLQAGAALVGLNTDGLKKSGTFAALAAHAVPIICAVEPTLEQPPSSAFFHPNEVAADPSLLTSPDGEARRHQLHTWFWATRSWEAIGRDMQDWLQV